MSTPDDDDDLGSLFAAKRTESQAKRARNREYGAEALRAAGIGFEVKNFGAHLIVAGHVDYYPGTGLWTDRTVRNGRKTEGRGIHNLLKHLNPKGPS